MRLAAYVLMNAFCLFAASAAPVEARAGSPTAGAEDRFGWMDAGGPRFTDWVRKQDQTTRHELAMQSGYSTLAAEVTGLSGHGHSHMGILLTRIGDVLFYERRLTDAGPVDLFFKRLPDGPETLLLDPIKASGQAETSIQTYTPSPDGRFVAIALTDHGSEEAVVRVLSVSSRSLLPEIIDRARFAVPEWDPDGTSFYYDRLQQPFPGMTPAKRFEHQTIYRHVIRTNPIADRPVFSIDRDHEEVGSSSFPSVMIPAGSPWAFVTVNSGVSREGAWWVAPVASLSRSVRPHWAHLAGSDEKLVQTPDLSGRPAVIDGHAYFISFKNAPLSRLVEIDLRKPGGHFTPVLPQGDGLLQTMTVARDGIYLAYDRAGSYRIVRYDPRSGQSSPVQVPFDGSLTEATADPRRDGEICTFTGWARPPQTYRIEKALQAIPLTVGEALDYDASPYVSEQIEARAMDGTFVPVSLLHRRDLRRSGTAPALVTGYGAYGGVLDASFMPWTFPFLDRGAVLATVHARGGGEFGEPWHLAGQKRNKPNTWRDFIAGVEALEAAGWTGPGRVTGWGASAGGIMISRAMTERPDLFAGAVMEAPLVDMIQFEQSEGGPSNTTEFGSVNNPDERQDLLEMSGYQHVVDGVRYPATLVIIGMNDHRVPPVTGAKMVARMQAAQVAGGPPIRLWASYDMGHGPGLDQALTNQMHTGILAFTLQAATRSISARVGASAR
ncbi:MAG: prolyl oligopeptidase family serine peptidase [Janthinobacterium lividum]